MKVRDVMTAEVCTVATETPLKEVARMLLEHGVSGLPVVDEDRRVLGIVSEGDFLEREAGTADRPRGPLWWYWAAGSDRAAATRSHATTAGAAMTSPAITIGPDRPLSEAAGVMARAKVNRLPVVDEGRLVGIVSRADVVRTFARSDEELAEIIRHSLRAVDGLNSVAVRDGVAVLEGSVGHESIARTVRHIVESIEGILAVDVQGLSWFPETPGRDEWAEAPPAGLARTADRTE
jgi:CBS domain-containing protein